VPGHAHVPAEHIGRDAEAGHMTDMAGPVGVRPGHRGEVMTHGASVVTTPSQPRPDTPRPRSSTISDLRHAPEVHSPDSDAVCNGTVTHPEAGGRPWPAPSPGNDWWRADEPDVSSDAAPDTSSDAAPDASPEASPGADAEADSDVEYDVDHDGLDDPAAVGPYDRPPRPPARPAATAPVPSRREPGPVAWVTEPVPVATPSAPPPSPVPRENRSAIPPARTVPAQRRPVVSPPRRPPRRRRRRLPRRPWFALPALVVLGLATTFFAWVSAEPFWLAVGHGRSGTATVVASAQGCRGFFLADDGSFIASDVDLRGLGPAECTRGAKVPAHMVSDRAEQAYATTALGLHLRWLAGLGLVLLCGLAITWLTGAARFAGWRRGVAVGLSLGGPAAMTIAMLTAAF